MAFSDATQPMANEGGAIVSCGHIPTWISGKELKLTRVENGLIIHQGCRMWIIKDDDSFYAATLTEIINSAFETLSLDKYNVSNNPSEIRRDTIAENPYSESPGPDPRSNPASELSPDLPF